MMALHNGWLLVCYRCVKGDYLHRYLASSEQHTWAAHVKLEMTQDNERLTKCRAPNAYGCGPTYSVATSE